MIRVSKPSKPSHSTTRSFRETTIVMPLVLSEQINDTDFEHLFAIQYNAFWKDPVIRAFYPGGLSDSARWDNVEIFIRTLGWRAHNVATAKVVDVQTGEICAFATMRMFDENPFTFAQPPHFEFPHIDEALRPAVEWVLNSKDTRRRTFEALHAPGSYCCTLLHFEVNSCLLTVRRFSRSGHGPCSPEAWCSDTPCRVGYQDQ